MGYKIIVDSCGELPNEWKQDARFASVPLELDVDDYHVVDDESFCQKEFLQKVKESPNSPKSACPSPQKYYDAFLSEAEHIYSNAFVAFKRFLQQCTDSGADVYRRFSR